MGRRDHPAAKRMDMLQNRDGERRSFGRVGARAKFIQQYKALRRHPAQNRDDVRHMAGKRTQALFDALLIPDIGVNRVKNAKLAAVFGGNEQPGHRHQAKQTDRFQGDGLPAGVRTSYDNRRVLIPQLYVDGYDLFRRNQRMTALLQLEVAAVVHARKRSLQLPGQSGFGEHKIQLAQHIAVIQQ
ncbi:hypothetical protein D3C81_1495920 [compost metagenome]